MLTLAVLATLMVVEGSPNLAQLESNGYQALRSQDTQAVVEIANQISSSFPKSFPAQMASGSLLIRSGKAKRALKAFDRAAELQPAQLPYLWQRGIALYYADEYALGREQFESHRAVNPHDVENAIWHFMCVARADGFDVARQSILPAPADSRIALAEIHALFAGRGTVAQVIAAMPAKREGEPKSNQDRFYGEFYLGVYEDLRGNERASIEWLEKATSYGLTHYMSDIARVHLQHVKDRQPSKAIDRQPSE